MRWATPKMKVNIELDKYAVLRRGLRALTLAYATTATSSDRALSLVLEKQEFFSEVWHLNYAYAGANHSFVGMRVAAEGQRVPFKSTPKSGASRLDSSSEPEQLHKYFIQLCDILLYLLTYMITLITRTMVRVLRGIASIVARAMMSHVAVLRLYVGSCHWGVRSLFGFLWSLRRRRPVGPKPSI